MRIKHILMLVLMLLCSTQVSAEIKLKKSFFGGWKYSVDGNKFKKVGFSGSGLAYELGENENAQLHMEKYKTAKTWALLTGIPGGFLIGWPIGGYIGGGEWKDGYTTMIVVGTPIAIASIIFEGSATRNMKKAVSIYNDPDQSLYFDIKFSPIEYSQSTTLLFGLTYSF